MSFSFKICPSNEHPVLISFKMQSLDLPAVQGTLKSLLQHRSSKASILEPSAFFIVQFSYPYMTTGKTIALTRWTFVGKVISLLLNMQSRLVITLLPRSNCHLISQLKELLFTAICEASSESHFAVLHFFFGNGLDSCVLYHAMNLCP